MSDANLCRMNAVHNKIQILGSLRRNPKIRTFENGKKQAKLNLLTSESYVDKNGKKITIRRWHTVVAYGRLAEIVERSILTGSVLTVEGKIISRSYVDRTGTRRCVSEVEAIEVLPSKCCDRQIPAPGFR